eukprot:TRINITY_DN7728_c0_g1_i3.p1 TRINITY_DN7728_c0_g1~~TRINITY_DN7728_c0_g1_i3.p1  ORF type:complete len:150 (+),score=24.46 TRINITY_DN7728_c0_g1_i3:966-1415(+)
MEHLKWTQQITGAKQATATLRRMHSEEINGDAGEPWGRVCARLYRHVEEMKERKHVASSRVSPRECSRTGQCNPEVYAVRTPGMAAAAGRSDALREMVRRESRKRGQETKEPMFELGGQSQGVAAAVPEVVRGGADDHSDDDEFSTDEE